MNVPALINSGITSPPLTKHFQPYSQATYQNDMLLDGLENPSMFLFWKIIIYHIPFIIVTH
jgi:hypothetical protein